MALLLPATGSAALVINSVVTTATDVTVLATWTDPDPGTVHVNLGEPNWDIDLISLAFGSGIGLQVVGAQHIIPSDAGEAPLGPALVLSFLGISPGVGEAYKWTGGIHPPGPHSDMLQVTITPTVAGVSSSVEVVASHVAPEPASLGLGLLGAGVLFGMRRWSTRRS